MKKTMPLISSIVEILNFDEEYIIDEYLIENGIKQIDKDKTRLKMIYIKYRSE